ncbi:MAG: DUF3048 domain-containing protein [Oscillospiraceae bacterium]|nr:DUF3048 domain-containing protein [Oscillospiraceae bacterium]
MLGRSIYKAQVTAWGDDFIKHFIAVTLCFCFITTLFSGCGKFFAADSSSTPAEPAGGEATNKPIVEYDYNPLTGMDKTEDYPVGQRPVAIMVNNLREALPQSGICDADLIYEMVTEAGITRMMAVYTDYTKVPNVGPVRSARDQFVQFMIPLNAIYVHIGSSIYADNMLNYYNYQNIDGMKLGTTAFYFDEARYRQPKASEHCWYTNAEKIVSGVQKVMEMSQDFSDRGGFDPVFNFYSQSEPNYFPDGGEAVKIAFRFSDYGDALFEYTGSGNYVKSEYDAPQMDENTSTQLEFKNIFLLMTDITLKADGYCTEFDLTQGTGYYFSLGKFEPITWKKGSPLDSLKVYKQDGTELRVNAGKSYIGVIDYDMAGTVAITGAAPEQPVEQPVEQPTA